MLRVIVVAGPTAIGKTNIAVRLAKQLQCSIINADSRQLYQEISIGTAKPSPQEMDGVKHYFVDCLHVDDLFTAGDFQKQASDIIAQEAAAGAKTILVSGGTGLYINTLMYGMHELPDGDEELRAALNDAFAEKGIAYLQEQVRLLDAEALTTQNENNPQRLMRILEVCQLSGKKYSELVGGKKETSNYTYICIGLDMERKALYKRIEERVDLMMRNGLLDEVKRMQTHRHAYALKTVGYKELFEYLDGEIDLERAIELIKQHTRNYAKRQLTWFRKDKSYQWFTPADFDAILQYINVELQA